MTGRTGGVGPAGASRFETLDALRGVCALAIALFHMPLGYPLRTAPRLDNLQFCVDIFFVMSGFVLLHAYGHRLGSPREAARFVLVRFGRLWPLHAATLALLVAVECLRFAYLARHPEAHAATPPFGDGRRPAEIATNLLFLQDFVTFGELSWNFPAWSIAVEFYAALILAGVVMLVGPGARWAFAALALLAGLALHAISPNSLFVIRDWGILRCLFDVFAGCLAYGLRDAARVPPRLASASEAAALAASLAVVALAPPGGLAYGAPLVFAVAVGLASHGRGLLSALARRGPLQSLGRWSFSIYLLHLPVIQVFTTGLHYAAPRLGLVPVEREGWIIDLGSPGLNLAVALALVGVTVALAALSYRLVERPSLAWFKALDRRLFAREPASAERSPGPAGLRHAAVLYRSP